MGEKLLRFTLSFFISQLFSAGAGAAVNNLNRGFSAVPDSSISDFQSLLTDSTATYSLGFLRIDPTHLNLAIIHLPSSVPLWTAPKSGDIKWSKTTRLIFNGSLLIEDTHSGAFWSTSTNGDRVWISNASNLIVDKQNRSILWQSFDFPSDTLLENQIFTGKSKLVSSNGLYSMRLGPDYIGLFANYGSGSGQIYFKHGALEAKADITEGNPIHILISPDGFLGMYQNGSSTPVDVETFRSFQQNGSGLRRIRLEPDGNLKAYYWIGSSWVLDYIAISDPCKLPNSCGSYGICQEGKGCSCIDNRTEYSSSGGCGSSENVFSGDFCGAGGKLKILRKEGVELARKELMASEKMDSQSECENECERNCSCWGAVYSNSSGFCYRLEYPPVQTLLAISDKTKTGYFKVREGAGKVSVVPMGLRVVIGVLIGAIILLGVVIGFGVYGIWRKRRREGVIGYGEEHGAPSVGLGPYKNLGADSFRSIELSNRR